MSEQQPPQFSENLLADENLAKFSPRAVAVLKKELADEEKVLWLHQPNLKALLKMSAIYTIFWLGVLLLWQITNISSWPVNLPVFVWLIAAHYMLWEMARHSLEVITDQRVLVIEASRWKTRLNSYYYHQQISYSTIKVESLKGDIGILSFALSSEKKATLKIPVSIRDVPQAQAVKQILEQALAVNAQNPLGQLSYKLQAIARPLLGETESVLWAAMPESYRLADASDIKKRKMLLAVIWIPLMLAELFWLISNVISGEFTTSLWLGLALVIVTNIICISVGVRLENRKKQIWQQAFSTGYLLTDQRFMLIKANENSPQVEIYPYQQFTDSSVVLTKNFDGTGNLAVKLGGEFPAKFTFLGVYEPEKVGQLIAQKTRENNEL